MVTGNAGDMVRHLKELNDDPQRKVGVVGPGGDPAFATGTAVPERIFFSQREVTVKEGGDLVFYRPLLNEESCHMCHNPSERTRGMLVIRNSMAKVNADIRGTAERIVLFAVFLGLISEVFLIGVLKRLVLDPLDSLRRGAQSLKAGDLSYRVRVRGNDEMGLLADSFNDMAEKISGSQGHLETTVRQKTKELKVIAELSTEVFRGGVIERDIIEQFLDAVTDRIGYRYAVICLVDRETGLLLQEFKRGIHNGLCSFEIPLSGNHPFAEAVRQARPTVRAAAEVGVPHSYGDLAIIPILSRQRKRCREATSCIYEHCPAFGDQDERCWLIDGTLCRSPQAVAGREKIYGCLHCSVFPVLGVLVAGVEEGFAPAESMHSLEILASEVASAMENQRLIESKKEDINSLVKLHDISVERIQSLDMSELTNSIVNSAVNFANMDAAVLWVMGDDGALHFADASMVERSLVPERLSVEDSFVGRSIIEERPIESVRMEDAGCLEGLIGRHGFMYISSIPLRFKGTVYGCLSMFKKKDFYMTDSEKAIILLFAAQSAAALNTASIHGELRVQKDFSDVVFNNMSMGIMVLDEEGKIRKLNPAGFEMLGIGDFVVGMDLSSVLPEASEFLVMDKDLGRVSDPGREIEIPVGGVPVPFGFSNSPLTDLKGESAGTVVVFRDLTEIKRLQAEVRNKQHFEALGKVIAGVAHEIRNPLFGISSLIQILERDSKSPEQQALLRAMYKESQRMKNLIEELLLYSRPSKLNIIDIDMGVFMEKLERYAKAKREDALFVLRVPSSFTLRGDPDKLTQVFLNLIDNSLNSGALSVEVSAREEGGRLQVEIKDDGSGIKKDNLARVYEPFFTTRKEGTGLGLAICRKLIEDHGGRIEIRSEEGRGTVVKLSFPL